MVKIKTMSGDLDLPERILLNNSTLDPLGSVVLADAGLEGLVGDEIVQGTDHTSFSHFEVTQARPLAVNFSPSLNFVYQLKGNLIFKERSGHLYKDQKERYYSVRGFGLDALESSFKEELGLNKRWVTLKDRSKNLGVLDYGLLMRIFELHPDWATGALVDEVYVSAFKKDRFLLVPTGNYFLEGNLSWINKDAKNIISPLRAILSPQDLLLDMDFAESYGFDYNSPLKTFQSKNILSRVKPSLYSFFKQGSNFLLKKEILFTGLCLSLGALAYCALPYFKGIQIHSPSQMDSGVLSLDAGSSSQVDSGILSLDAGVLDSGLEGRTRSGILREKAPSSEKQVKPTNDPLSLLDDISLYQGFTEGDPLKIYDAQINTHYQNYVQQKEVPTGRFLLVYSLRKNEIDSLSIHQLSTSLLLPFAKDLKNQLSHLHVPAKDGTYRKRIETP